MPNYKGGGRILIKHYIKETKPKKEKIKKPLPDQFQDDKPSAYHNDTEDDNEFLDEEDQVHKCSECKEVKKLFVFNKYTQLCSDCYSKESTRLANEYYDSLRKQEELRPQIRGMLNEQNHNKRRVES